MHRLLIVTVMVAAGGIVACGSARGQSGMPFAETYRRPSVSPYTMLATSAVVGPGSNVSAAAGIGLNPLVYQQLVQPRVQQEQAVVTQMRQGRQIEGLSNRVQQIQGAGFARQVGGIRPTGHGATYLNLSHFYGR